MSDPQLRETVDGRQAVMLADEIVSACVFCEKIDRGEVTDCGRGVGMFEPLNPVTPGHMLFVPEIHVADAGQQPWVTGAVFEAASAWGEMAARDFNLITSAGSYATQTITHLHVHYVPRREGDGLHLPWTGHARAELEGGQR